MRYPSVDMLLEKVDSKYKLAYIAARRAKVIEEENGYTADGVEVICDKPVGQALEEVLAGKVSVTFKPAETIFSENNQED
ncbi:MAG: DNA-directed RNA polymerase subunit omega [Anaeroplasmataceae bacterium]